ncbi:MAG: S8/S53 family peptidase [Saprospiraceae bacterium]
MMNTKKYLVTEEMHIRRVSMLSENYIIGSLPKGFTIDVVGEEYGAMYTYNKIKSNVWLKDIHGFYYWKGGVVEQNPVLIQPPKKELHKIAYQGEIFEHFIKNCYKESTLYSQIDYFDFLQIPPFAEEVKQKVMVGLIDHPISSVLPTTQKIMHIRSVKMEPRNPHGTALAGLIVGAGDIKGIAKFLQIIELPIYDEWANRSPELKKEIVEYIDKITAEDPLLRLVINVSHSFEDDDFLELSPLINNRSVILVASAGTNEELSPIRQIPASKEGVIAVGTISSDYRKKNANPVFDPKLDIILPHFRYPSYGNASGYFEDTGEDSAAAAIVSALISLMVQYTSIGFTVQEIKDRLLSLSKPYSDINSFQKLNLINPSL